MSEACPGNAAQGQGCRVMGILNVTPDSFSDGGRFADPDVAVRRAATLIADGADIIDIGGESTRPGSTPISWEEEWSRVEPVLKGINSQLSTLNSKLSTLNIKLSIDTYHPETAERAVALGVTIVNCVYEEPIPAMLGILAANPEVELVMPAKSFPALHSPFPPLLGHRLRRLASLGGYVPRIYLDPMIGFGTTREEDLALLRSVPELAKKGRVLVGASRKRIVRALAGEESTVSLLGGDIAIALWSMAHGASVVRVHDVKEVAQALRVYRKI